MPRPVKYILTNQTFGVLYVEGPYRDTNRWQCKCKCGNTVTFTTAELRWGRKRDCGCRQGTDKPISIIGNTRSYKSAEELIDLVPSSVLQTFGVSQNKQCSICGLVPARRIVPIYGIRDPRFLDGHKSPEIYLTLCGICYSVAKELKAHLVAMATPERWLQVAKARYGGTLPEVMPGLRDMAKIVKQHQTFDEQTSTSGSVTRQWAEELLSHDC